MSQAKPASKQLNLNKLSDADGLKSGGCSTPAEPVFESRSVYLSKKCQSILRFF
ncbi:MAG: hypothetical protein HY069_01295 [Chlamydiia bacterium]|nr:hypothetical protein [Chlamydiia bacterium]